VAGAPARQASPQVPKLSTQAASCDVPPNRSSMTPNRSVPRKAGAKADAGVEPGRCSQITRGGNGEHARGEIRKVALYDEAGNHGKSQQGDVGQHRGEAEQTAGKGREHEDEGGDGPQPIADRELVADQAGGYAEKIDHGSDHQNDPGLRGISGVIAGTKGQEDDNPLPQSDATPDGGGVADDQGEDIPVCKHRAKVEQRLGIVLVSGIPARQCRQGNDDTGGAENAGDNKGAAPAQEDSNPAEQERQRGADGERARVPRRNAGTGCPFDAMRECPQAGHIHAGHGDAGQSAESERREQTVG